MIAKIVNIVMFFIFQLTAFSAHSEALNGFVVSVYDGDTITITIDGSRQVKIRLAEIDAPEKVQPYGQIAGQVLSSLVLNKTVAVNVQTIDIYGRSVGRIAISDLDVNAEMVRQGAAWVYREYSKDQKLYALEDEAKVNKVGLWGLPPEEQVPPWVWRNGKIGDVAPLDNPDGEINIGDAVVVARMVAGLVPVDLHADVAPLGNPDGEINIGDAVVIARVVAGLVTLTSTTSVPTTTTSVPTTTTSVSFECGQKKTCSEMVSCDEARFYLTQCGKKSLDGDGDGIPCESLCR